jgi:16S rRNA (cytosine967-C5)-methyltransferase
MSQDEKAGLAARRAVLAMLSAVINDGAALPETDAVQGLAPADRARAQRLALAVLRNYTRADALIAPLVERAPVPAVRNVLRLAMVELFEDGAAAHGVVDSAVRLVKDMPRHSRAAGMVNALLRKVVDMERADWLAAPAPGLPDWLRGPVVKAYGEEAAKAMEAAHLSAAPLDITVKSDAPGWADRLGAQVLPTGSLRLRQPGQVSALPGYAEGAWWVQDAAAALPAQALGVQPGERVLDLCAAPGGKTMQLAAMGGRVTAVDMSRARMKRVAENLERTGLKSRTISRDALTFTETGFDAILLDAPCSASGTLRRHPDLPFAKAGRDLGQIAALQARLLDHALGLLAPGGRLVFATCSLLPGEGERQVALALKRHKGLRVDPVELPGIPAQWHDAQGGIRLRPDYWPELGGMDGFYFARLSFGDA